MNLIFSFDSILSALAITDVLLVLASDCTFRFGNVVSSRCCVRFLAKNRKYEVLGMFILLIVGIVLLGEGGHVSHLKLFGFEVAPISKATFTSLWLC